MALYSAPNATRTYTLETRHVMCIDLTHLYEAFPSFAALSEADQKAILDTLPYFYGDMTLGGELDGYSLNNIHPLNWADYPNETPSYGSLAGYQYDVVKGHKYFCSIITKYPDSLTDDEVAEAAIPTFSFVCEGNRVAWTDGKKERGDQHLSLIGTASVSGKSYNNMYAYASVAMTWKQTMAIDLTSTGHYTLFKLLGMSDDDIKAFLDTLPYFADTYDIGREPLKLTAIAGDHTASIILGYVQDGGSPQYWYQYTDTPETEPTYDGWTTTIPQGAEYSGKHLWIKIVNPDGTETIVPPASVCRISIQGAQTYQADRSVASSDQTLEFAVVRDSLIHELSLLDAGKVQ